MAEGKVLMADDEEYIRDLVSSALRIAGFETMTATDGFEVCPRLRADGDATPGRLPHRPGRQRGQDSASPRAATTT